MSQIAHSTEMIPVILDEETTVVIEVVALRGIEEDVAAKSYEFADVLAAITRIGSAVRQAVKAIEPETATVEFGLSFAASNGGLTALLLKGEGKANLKVSLEWKHRDDDEPN